MGFFTIFCIDDNEVEVFHLTRFDFQRCDRWLMIRLFLLRRLVLISIVCSRYYSWTFNCASGGVLVRAYLIGMLAVLSLVVFVLVLLVNRSAQGAIWDTDKRKLVGPLLIIKWVFRRENLAHIRIQVYTYVCAANLSRLSRGFILRQRTPAGSITMPISALCWFARTLELFENLLSSSGQTKLPLQTAENR